MQERKEIFGIVGSFPDEKALAAAAKKAGAEGFTSLTTFSPYESEHTLEVLGKRDKIIQAGAYIAGVFGIAGGYFLQYYTTVISYPIDIGGRPLNSVPAFMQVTFEMMVLSAALFSFFAVFFLSGLPRLHQPISNSQLVSEGGFCLLVKPSGPIFNLEKASAILNSAGAIKTEEVADE